MTVKLNSYISLMGNAREAVEFYKGVFGGEAYIDTFGKYADKMPVDEEHMDKIMHAYIKGDHGVEVMLSDAMNETAASTGSQITMTLNGDEEDVLMMYWEKLSDGGNVTQPMSQAPWGDKFGMLTDRFGVDWMINIGPTQQQ